MCYSRQIELFEPLKQPIIYQWFYFKIALVDQGSSSINGESQTTKPKCETPSHHNEQKISEKIKDLLVFIDEIS